MELVIKYLVDGKIVRNSKTPARTINESSINWCMALADKIIESQYQNENNLTVEISFAGLPIRRKINKIWIEV